MKVAGIVAEYNPLHNGHQYQINYLKQELGFDYVIVIMSGDFVQRGAPAIYDKYTRTKAALAAGVDLVLELPAAYATSSAEDFAAGAVSILDALGVVDSLCFGSECGDIAILQKVADVLAKEPDVYKEALQRGLKEGLSFPSARQIALSEYLESADVMSADVGSAGMGGMDCIDMGSIISSPNNILGIEYLKALKKLGSHITPITIKREGASYHEDELADDINFPSATALRGAMKRPLNPEMPIGVSNSLGAPTLEVAPVITDILKGKVPDCTLPFYMEAHPLFEDDLSLLMNQRLLQLCSPVCDCETQLEDYLDVSDALAARIRKQLLPLATFSGRVTSLKTKQITYTRVSRALLHILLSLRQEQMNTWRHGGYAYYGRVLGFGANAAPLLSAIKAHASIPLVTKTADAEKLLTEEGFSLLSLDFYASHLYQALLLERYGVEMKNEYTQSVIHFHDTK